MGSVIYCYALSVGEMGGCCLTWLVFLPQSNYLPLYFTMAVSVINLVQHRVFHGDFLICKIETSQGDQTTMVHGVFVACFILLLKLELC